MHQFGQIYYCGLFTCKTGSVCWLASTGFLRASFTRERIWSLKKSNITSLLLTSTLHYYLPLVMKSTSSPLFLSRALLFSQWCWVGSGHSKFFSMATMVESGMGVARNEFLANAADREQSTHTSANPSLSWGRKGGGDCKEQTTNLSHTISCHLVVFVSHAS